MPTTRRTGRHFRLERGLQDMLEVAMESKLTARVDLWKDQISKGEIDEELREILAALGWISSRDDPRLVAGSANPVKVFMPAPVRES